MMKTINIQGLKIAYVTQGEGEPLMLLHGGISDSRYWRDQIDALSDAFRVVAWDAPGFGQSDDPPEGFSMEDYADYLAMFIDELELDHPHVLGLSFGGGLAIALYKHHPGMPRSLILASAYAGWAGSLPPEEVATRLERGIEHSQRSAEDMINTYIPTLYDESSKKEDIERVSNMIADFHPEGTRISLKAFAEADYRDVLPTISVPTLLLYGENDQRSPLHIAEAMHERIPRSELVTIPGVGHDSNIEDPETFNREVRNFLMRVDTMT